MEKVYLLEGLDCANCAMKVERNVKKVDGVKEVTVDFVSKKMVIDYVAEDLFARVNEIVLRIEPDIVMRELINKPSCTTHTHECKHKVEQHDHEAAYHHKHGEHENHTGCCCNKEDGAHPHNHESHDEHERCGCGGSHEALEERIIEGATKLYVRGLDCANCAAKIEQYIIGMPNVKDASLNFSTGLLYVEMRNASKKEETIQAIQTIIPTLEKGVLVQCEKKGEDDTTTPSAFSMKHSWKLYLAILFFIAGIVFEETNYGIWLIVIAYILAGGRVVLSAVRNIVRGEMFDENFLMSVATIGAFAVQSYDEAVAVMIFYEIGEMFQSFAVNRSRKSISSLMNIRADFANVLINDKEVRKSPEDVKVNDIILIKPGERVPLDGILIEGNSTMDTSALTGESLPRDVQVQDEILAGVVNLSGMIKVQVTKEYGESTVSRILELVENASSKKAPMEKFITKFARIYTPIVVGLAIALVVLPMLFIPNADVNDWLYRALTFLVVSCPCALVISIPLGLFAGIGAASRKGILVKGGNYLEALKDVDTVVFDKTGTLTKGVFNVVDVKALNISKDELLEIAAYGEYYSNHPIANSIRNAYGKTIDTSTLNNYREIAGNGIQVQYKNDTLLLGNYKLMMKYQISYQEPDTMGSVIHIAKNEIYYGYIVIDDEIKETSKAAIAGLKQMGINKTIMLSGDRKIVGEYIGKQLGLDEIHMQLLPDEKVLMVESLLGQQQGTHKLAFVGDGINDAPVLARADIGVAMGGIGSDAAIEAADVVLMKDDPKALCEAIMIAKKTMRILWQNLAFSLGIKAIFLILTAFGLANMWMGVFADVGVTLLAIINSMRALRS